MREYAEWPLVLWTVLALLSIGLACLGLSSEEGRSGGMDGVLLLLALGAMGAGAWYALTERVCILIRCHSQPQLTHNSPFSLQTTNTHKIDCARLQEDPSASLDPSALLVALSLTRGAQGLIRCAVGRRMSLVSVLGWRETRKRRRFSLVPPTRFSTARSHNPHRHFLLSARTKATTTPRRRQRRPHLHPLLLLFLALVLTGVGLDAFLFLQLWRGRLPQGRFPSAMALLRALFAEPLALGQVSTVGVQTKETVGNGFGSRGLL